MKWLKRIRPTNLLIIIATQLLVYLFYALPISIGDIFNSDYPSFKYYVVIAFITCIVTSGGYIINDIFDSEIDKINKPSRALYNVKEWKRVYKALFIIGLVLVFYVSYQLENLYFTPIYILTWFVLFQYSKNLKCKPLIGNVIVAFLSSASVLLVIAPALHIYLRFDEEQFNLIFLPIYYYTLMAFMLSLLREIVKDMEDVEGDKSQNCRTMAVQAGMNRTKYVVQFFTLCTILFSAGFTYIFSVNDRISWVYFIGIIILLLFFQAYRLNRGGAPKEFHSIQKFYKIMMILGILFFLVEPYLADII